jgi:hypothetical protein
VVNWIADNLGYAIVAVFILLIGNVCYFAHRDSVAYDRLFQSCLNDGYRDYECYSILNRTGSTPIITPIVIPGR